MNLKVKVIVTTKIYEFVEIIGRPLDLAATCIYIFLDMFRMIEQFWLLFHGL